ncbi:MAG TPA: hypothetical protein VKS60_05355, partial [Stellaceae bacterium]|nr:hypothetical protein [Stellaceae bacterium]
MQKIGTGPEYQGDAALARLLDQAGAPLDVAGVRDLVQGVLGAPPARDPDEWCLLVAAEPSRALVAQLQALKSVLAAEAAAKALPPVAERVSGLRAKLRE